MESHFSLVRPIVISVERKINPKNTIVCDGTKPDFFKEIVKPNRLSISTVYVVCFHYSHHKYSPEDTCHLQTHSLYIYIYIPTSVKKQIQALIFFVNTSGDFEFPITNDVN